MNKVTQNPIISLCIPTYNRPEILKKTLDSIYSQGVSDSSFEVCISDDSSDDRTSIVVEEYLNKHNNIVYRKNNERQIYKNLIEVLKMGRGRLLKLLNDYCLLKENALSDIITFISQFNESTGIVFLKNNNDIFFNNIDELFYFGNYHLTWCSSFSIWKKDFDKLLQKRSCFDEFFPHFDLLINSSNDNYAVYSKNPFVLQKAHNQGGYHLPNEFIIRLFKMIYAHNDKFSQKTIKHFKFKTVEFIAKRFNIEKISGFENDYYGCSRIIYNEFGIFYCIYYYYRKIICCRRKK